MIRYEFLFKRLASYNNFYVTEIYLTLTTVFYNNSLLTTTVYYNNSLLSNRYCKNDNNLMILISFYTYILLRITDFCSHYCFSFIKQIWKIKMTTPLKKNLTKKITTDSRLESAYSWALNSTFVKSPVQLRQVLIPDHFTHYTKPIKTQKKDQTYRQGDRGREEERKKSKPLKLSPMYT